jgi:hypothetical protein
MRKSLRRSSANAFGLGARCLSDRAGLLGSGGDGSSHAALKVELAPGGPPIVRARDDAAAVEDLHAVSTPIRLDEI